MTATFVAGWRHDGPATASRFPHPDRAQREARLRRAPPGSVVVMVAALKRNVERFRPAECPTILDTRVTRKHERAQL
jgi:hypothetical protein